MNELKCPKCGKTNATEAFYEVEEKDLVLYADGTGYYRGNWYCEKCQNDYKINYSFTWQMINAPKIEIWE